MPHRMLSHNSCTRRALFIRLLDIFLGVVDRNKCAPSPVPVRTGQSGEGGIRDPRGPGRNEARQGRHCRRGSGKPYVDGDATAVVGCPDRFVNPVCVYVCVFVFVFCGGWGGGAFLLLEILRIAGVYCNVYYCMTLCSSAILMDKCGKGCLLFLVCGLLFFAVFVTVSGFWIAHGWGKGPVPSHLCPPPPGWHIPGILVALDWLGFSINHHSSTALIRF